MGQTKKRNYDRYTLAYKLQAVKLANHPDVKSKDDREGKLKELVAIKVRKSQFGTDSNRLDDSESASDLQGMLNTDAVPGNTLTRSGMVLTGYGYLSLGQYEKLNVA